jgi:hypothetical protein
VFGAGQATDTRSPDSRSALGESDGWKRGGTGSVVAPAPGIVVFVVAFVVAFVTFVALGAVVALVVAVFVLDRFVVFAVARGLVVGERFGFAGFFAVRLVAIVAIARRWGPTVVIR